MNVPVMHGVGGSFDVLAGRTKRGEGETIHAVILLCDLRDSTRLSKSIPMKDFFRSLNEFFDCTAEAVLEHGGEILSYIGDAVLAIFTIGGTERPLGEACFREEGACAAALAAARAPGRGWMLLINGGCRGVSFRWSSVSHSMLVT